ncbi:MAG TPA: CBS domain-containing protein [Anaerolineaceae bacterium]
MLVGDRMSRPVITVSPQTSLEDALKIMRSEHISRLPVVKKNGELAGIVTEKQLLRFSPSNATTLDVWEIRGVMSRMTVEQVMATDVVTITADLPLEEAARLMVDKEIGGIPVVKDNKVVGIITETDLFKIFLEVLGAREQGIRLTVTVSKEAGKLAKLAQAVYGAGGNIISLGTFLGDSSAHGEITMKVDGISKEKLVETVLPFVIEVLDVRMT